MLVNVEAGGMAQAVRPAVLLVHHVVEVLLPAGGVHHVAASAGVRGGAQVGVEEEGLVGGLLYHVVAILAEDGGLLNKTGEDQDGAANGEFLGFLT